eukprot:SAG11_NODE_3740_length_2255_cov_2.157236_3_plen_63_part_00
MQAVEERIFATGRAQAARFQRVHQQCKDASRRPSRPPIILPLLRFLAEAGICPNIVCLCSEF